MSNFCIQRSVHFCLKNGENSMQTGLSRTVFEPGEPARDVVPCTRHVGLAVPGPRAHADAPEDLAHSPAGEPPSAIGRQSAARSHRLRTHVSAPVDHEGRAKLPLRATDPIKLPLHVFLARPSNTATRRSPPLASPVILLLRSRPWPTDNPKLLPSTHLSSHTHVMAYHEALKLVLWKS
jgi:hypothetical protein